MRQASWIVGLTVASSVAAFGQEPEPVGPGTKAIDERIDAALAAPAAERAEHVRRLAEDAPAAIARLLDRARSPDGVPKAGVPTARGVQLGVRFVQATPAIAREWLGEPPAGRALASRRLEGSAREKLLEAIEASADVQQIRAAELTLYDGQRASLQVLNTLSYVQDFDVEVAQSPFSHVVDPIVGNVVEGTMLELLAHVEAEGRVLLDLDVATCSVVKPLLVEDIQVSGATVQVQRPESHTARVTRKQWLAPGVSLLLAAPRPAADTSDQVGMMVLEAKVVDLQEGAAAEPKRVGEMIEPKTPDEAPPELPRPGIRPAPDDAPPSHK